MTLFLRPIEVSDEKQVVLAHEIMAHESFAFAHGYRPERPFAEYVSGTYHDPSWVPFTFFVGVVGETIVGRLSLRHDLTPDLSITGGHIGYCVLPQYRGLGYAISMLRQSLEYAQKLGIEQALLTCSEDNYASQRVIERCGGALVADHLLNTRRYWIPTSYRCM